MRNIFKKIFVFFVFINLVNIKLNAKIDNLQEWSQACFKNCKEYCTDFTTVINKSVLSDNDEEAFKEFNGVLVQATSSIRSRNKKKVHPYVEKIRLNPVQRFV